VYDVVDIFLQYSNRPSYLVDLQYTLAHLKKAQLAPPGKRRSVSGPPRNAQKWAMDERLAEGQVAEIIRQYRAGKIGKELAAEFKISLSSVRRLLRNNGGRLKDQRQPTE
jgi:hypothetical protein